MLAVWITAADRAALGGRLRNAAHQLPCLQGQGTRGSRTPPQPMEMLQPLQHYGSKIRPPWSALGSTWLNKIIHHLLLTIVKVLNRGSSKQRIHHPGRKFFAAKH